MLLGSYNSSNLLYPTFQNSGLSFRKNFPKIDNVNNQVDFILPNITLTIIKYLKNLASSLPYIQKNLKISDFDDTLFSRDKQLSDDIWLKKNRWSDWIEYILTQLWLSKYLLSYYIGRNIPDEIHSQMNSKIDIILTAWNPSVQKSKIKLFEELRDYKIIVTKNWEDKVMALINYVLYTLKFIPSKITVYEDRPQFFLKHRILIEYILWIPLEIIHVEMDWNDWYKRLNIL